MNSQNAKTYLKFMPSNTQSMQSGGTADILPKERAKASFDVQSLIHYLNGGENNTKKRKFVEGFMNKDLHDYYNYTRPEIFKTKLKEFIEVHKKFPNYKPSRYELMCMSGGNQTMGSLRNSHNFFLITILGQGNAEQQKLWMPKIINFEITGAYAQTELGHGSNVRGIQTTAVYDRNTDEFVLNTPTLRSMKWWPGALGKSSTHCTLLAQLIADGKELGVKFFIVQIRDENYLPLKGITLGDLGNKMGDDANDTGFMTLENIRIPRTNMLSKYQEFTRDGELVTVTEASPQVLYSSMTFTRAMIIYLTGDRLCQAATIAIRYSCVRKQGFKTFDSGISYLSEENAIIDHKIQQYRLFKQLAYAYAIKLIGNWMSEQIEIIEGGQLGQLNNLENLKEVAMASAGLKSLCTQIAGDGIEDLRKCCGGNGYLLNSGIATMRNDYLILVTAEGDMALLAIVTGKYLVQTVEGVIRGKKAKGFVEYLNVLSNSNFNTKSLLPSLAQTNTDFLNFDYLLRLFRYRSIKRSHDLHSEFMKLVQNGEDLQKAFESLAMEASLASYAHSYYIILLNFTNRIQAIKDTKISTVLTRLCLLFACCNLREDNWGGILESSQFKFINQTINILLSEIRPDCISLCDAFDYSDFILKSTIGRYDGNVYEALFDAAQHSTLNKQEVFQGFDEVLKPHLNKKLLKHGNNPIDFRKAKF